MSNVVLYDPVNTSCRDHKWEFISFLSNGAQKISEEYFFYVFTVKYGAFYKCLIKVRSKVIVSVTDPVFQGSNLPNKYEDDR